MALLHPEADLSMSLVTWGADLLRQLHAKKGILLVDHLMDNWLRMDRRRVGDDFFNTLDFLYALGTIDREGYRIRLVTTSSSQQSLFDDLGGREE